MFVAGHVGMTLGVYAFLAGKRKLTFGKIALLSVVALSPDFLDRGLHAVLPAYQSHGIFHSVFLYAVLVPAFYFLRRGALLYPSVMFLNVALDSVNTDLRVFLFPLYGRSPEYYGRSVRSPVESFLRVHPAGIGYKLPTGHFLIFEVIGALIIIWVLLNARSSATGERAERGFSDDTFL